MPTSPAIPSSQKEYWRFYWPLAVMGVATLIARQFENGALAHYPDAAKEIAIFAYASSTYFLFSSALIFSSQTVTVLGRSPRARRVILRLLLVSCVVITAPLAVIAYTPLGKPVLHGLYDIDGYVLETTQQYLQYLTPLVVVMGMRQHINGLLVQTKRTGIFTVLNIILLVTTVLMLMLGLNLGWSALLTVSMSQIVAAGVHLVLSGICYLLYYKPPEKIEYEKLTYKEAFEFLWPVVVTSMMFSISRPILYFFVSRMNDSERIIAALRVAFDFTMIFHVALNQARHLYVTYGKENLVGIRTFTFRVAAGITVLMVLVVATPISSFCLRTLMNIREDLFQMTIEALWVLCLIPMVVIVRNYFHGYLLVHQKTRGMSVGGIMRNVAIYCFAWACWSAGILNHIAAAGILVTGFIAEIAMAQFFTRQVAKGNRKESIQDPESSIQN